MEEKKVFDLLSFKRASSEMIAKNDNSWRDNNYLFDTERFRKGYTLEEIQGIIEGTDLSRQRALSRAFFTKDGFYSRLILHYATLLTYKGLLIPNPSFGLKLSTPFIEKRYFAAMDYADANFTPDFFTQKATKVLIDGVYYGVLQKIDKNNFICLDLPAKYCKSRFKDYYGNDIIEFDVSYFDTIIDKADRDSALSGYPKVISSYYRTYKRKRKDISSFVKIPTDISVYFSFNESSRPPFLNVIPSTLQYDEAVETERERDLEEIRKIIVQKVPHLNDGTLLFEPEEAAEMHRGSVDMMKKNKNVSVLTTYTDVDSIVSKGSNDSRSNSIEKMMQNIYSQAGTSSEIFSPTGSQALSTSITNDIAYIMSLAYKFSLFATKVLNLIFGNANIRFKYEILPISYHNKTDFITDSMKLAQTGYSFILPSLAMGLSQKELCNIKELENDVLKLDKILKPLSSSYTQSGDGETNKPGAPEKPLEQKEDKTIRNEEAIDNQGGSK